MISIKNSVFLNSKKNKLKNNLDMEKIVIIIYEIMENIINLEYDIDYIIIINYDSKTNSFNYNDVDIIDSNQFYQINPDYEQIDLDKGYFEPKNTKNKNNVNLAESTLELLNSKEENKNESNVRRIKSGKIRNISINGEYKESNKLRGKRTVNKKIEENKDLKNNGEEGEENIDELHSNEKIHNISYNFQKKKNEINNDLILLNQKNKTKNNIKDIEGADYINELNKNEKEESNDEQLEINPEYKIYFFNEKQMIINLSSYKGEIIKPVGLINPSIYCFMICILQALISIPELNYFFLSKIYLLSNIYNNNSKSNKEISEEDYPVCYSYQHFVKIYLLSRKNYIQINRNLFRICNKLLGGMHMHDSQEFFVCFLEAMQEELNSLNKNKKNQNDKKNETQNKMEEKWINYREKNNSFIDSLFTGLMRSTVECKSCKYRSITYDPFIDLNVSINKYKNLEKCLKQYFEYEKIDCEYKCDNCKQISKVSIIINI